MTTSPLFKAMLSVLILTIITTVFSCGKEEGRIRISGTVTDPLQQIPVADAEVTLTGKMLQGGSFNPDPSVITMTNTASDGSFSIDIAQVRASELTITIRKRAYFNAVQTLTVQEVSSDKAYEGSWLLHPEGWVNLRVQNTTPGGASDLITYRIFSDNPECSNCCNSDYVQGPGPQYDNTVLCRSSAGTTAKVLWNVHKWNFSRADTTYLNIPLFDTVYYHITY